MSSYTSQDIYTPTDWEDYPSTATKITALRLNKMERAALGTAKESSTFLINSLFGGLKSTQNISFLTPTQQVTINNYSPQSGDKLLVWVSGGVPCVIDEDYEVEEANGDYKIKAKGQSWADVCLQIWNIPTSSGGGVSGSAYVALSSLATDSISGTETQEQEGE